MDRPPVGAFDSTRRTKAIPLVAIQIALAGNNTDNQMEGRE